MESGVMLIDTHCHLVNEDYDIDRVIKNAVDNGVKYLIVGGSEREDNRLNMELLNRYDNVYASVGFHPSMALEVTEDDYLLLEKYVRKDKVVAVGEIGLDYHYGKDDMEEQKKMFRRQLELAKRYSLPVVIHTRDAFLDTYNILKEYDLNGVIHCFSGSLEVAKQYIDLGYFLGIGGVITFKNSKLKDVIKEIGLGKVVFETDSPYLSPIRGDKNEPKNVKLVCECVSNLLNMTYDDVSLITSKNVNDLFNLNIKSLK